MRMSGSIRRRTDGWRVVGLCILVAGLGLSTSGCGGRSGRPSRARRPAADQAPASQSAAMPAMSQEVRDQLLDGALDVLSHLENYDEKAAYGQVFDRLNQWSHAITGGGAADPWKPDPLLLKLPESLRGAGAEKALASAVFNGITDISTLRDQRWLADVAASARGPAIQDIDVAQRLFAWTVQSLAISSDPPMVPTESTPGTRWFQSGEILLAGRASAAQRAWIFLDLVRHAGLDGVMLATGDASQGTLRPWIPAVLCGQEAYLFDPGYGMPIPGPNGTGVATARQAAEDPSILRGMSLPDRPYPVQAADIARLTVLVPATEWSLSRRMHMLDRSLAGTRRIDVSVDASAVGARALAALPVVGEATENGAAERIGLWEFPWLVQQRRRDSAAVVDAALNKELAVMGVTLAQADGTSSGRRMVRPLYAARLREFRGELDGPDGAKAVYLLARPGNQQIAEALVGLQPPQADAIKRLYEQMKEDSTYWLGLLTLNEGEAETAVDYLERMTLQAHPEGPWTDAARNNLARAKLALGERAEGVKILREDTSPQRFGSRLRADQWEKNQP